MELRFSDLQDTDGGILAGLLGESHERQKVQSWHRKFPLPEGEEKNSAGLFAGSSRLPKSELT